MCRKLVTIVFSRLKKCRHEVNDKKLQKVKVNHSIWAKWIIELSWEIQFKNEAIWKYLYIELGKIQAELGKIQTELGKIQTE